MTSSWVFWPLTYPLLTLLLNRLIYQSWYSMKHLLTSFCQRSLRTTPYLHDSNALTLISRSAISLVLVGIFKIFQRALDHFFNPKALLIFLMILGFFFLPLPLELDPFDPREKTLNCDLSWGKPARKWKWHFFWKNAL